MTISTIEKDKLTFTRYLTDPHNRYYKKLRISVNDSCNFRCNYCMPDLKNWKKGEKPILNFTKNLLTPQEIFEIAKNLVFFGVEEIRITGGEPTLRKDLMEIIHLLSNLKLKKLAITTNAFKLKKILTPINTLADTLLTGINISLDSLDPFTFHKITGKKNLDLILGNIVLAKELGFKVKINCVIMRGINDHELFDFIDFAKQYDLTLRFLEVMKIGVINQKKGLCVSSKELLTKVKTKFLVRRLFDQKDSTSMNYEINGKTNNIDNSIPIKIGFIASETVPFCHNCSRLRLTADGKLKACLFKENRINIRGLPISGYPNVLEKIKKLKPTSRIVSTNENMFKIGG